jgi:hypothetical protein
MEDLAPEPAAANDMDTPTDHSVNENANSHLQDDLSPHSKLTELLASSAACWISN